MNPPTMNVNNWECPVCKATMGYKSEFGGFLTHENTILIPLICAKCGMEVWIKAITVSAIVFKEFENRLKK